MPRLFLRAAVAAAATCGLAASVHADEDFYAGKTMKIVIGAGMGGEYGLYSQLIANHLPRHIPGRPTIIVESMPGAGGLRSLNYLAKVAPQDGTTLTLAMVNIVHDGLLNPEQVRFDPGRFQWVGRVAGLVQAGVVWSKRSNVKTLADAKTKELVAGGVGTNNPTALNPRILNTLAGTKFKIVTGYRGTNDVQIAWERGEVDVLTTSWDTMRVRFPNQIKSGDIVPIYAYALKRAPGLEDVPLMTELGRNDAEKAFLKIYTIGTEIGRSLAAPPGVPKDRIAILRAAFTKMLGDPDFKAAVAKGNIRFNPLDGVALAAAVADVLRLPAGQVAQARKFYRSVLAPAK